MRPAINADRPMDTMSVIKIPLMVEAFRQMEAGKFLTRPLVQSRMIPERVEKLRRLRERLNEKKVQLRGQTPRKLTADRA